MIALPLALIAVVAAPAAGGDARPPALAFVHVEANVGGSSGGHSALRIGNFVYHFQQTDSRRLHLERDDWAAFRQSYAALQNRTLHLAWVDVLPDDVERIARRFSSVFVDQEIDRARAARQREDVAWLEALRDHAPLPPLRGAGLSGVSALHADGADDADAEDGDELRSAIASGLGGAFVDGQIAAVDGALASFRPRDGSTDLEPLRELLTLREALHALDPGRAPPPDLIVDDLLVDDADVGTFGGTLRDDERTGIARLRDAQREGVIALLKSARPDRGFALAVAVARHRALTRTLRLGRWILLDPFPDDAPRRRPADDEEAETQARLAARAVSVAHEVEAALFARPEFDEGLFNSLEEVVARGREAQRGARGEEVRQHADRMIPSRGRSVGDATEVAACFAGIDLRAAASAARAAWVASEQAAGERYAYSLLERNCVTELVRTVNSAFPDDAAVVAALGARIEPGESLGFVPWVFHDQVIAGFRVVRQEVILSHRLEELARLEAADAGAFALLREETTLSSTIYRPRSVDGEFLFFTDDVVWQRPLRGVVNVGYGVGQGLAGILTAPFDGGRRFLAGFHGAFFSVPELFFANVRKGSFDFVEPTPR